MLKRPSDNLHLQKKRKKNRTKKYFRVSILQKKYKKKF